MVHIDFGLIFRCCSIAFEKYCQVLLKSLGSQAVKAAKVLQGFKVCGINDKVFVDLFQ